MTTDGERFYRHGLRRMTGRDINERHRAASTLELFFDLTFVTAFGVAGAEFAHGIAVGHAGPASIAFFIAMLAIVWAWTSYSWFASAFDNDDWLFRVLTLVQMAGVIVVAIGIPALFESVAEGQHFVGAVMVAGYVIMRLAVIAQWLRVATGDPRFRGLAISNVVTVGVAQVGWVVFIVLPVALFFSLWLLVLLWLFDLGGPLVVELWSRRRGAGSPWHPHHIAERYSLMAIIALGETVTGTLSAAQQISAAQGWTLDAVVVIATGIVVSFALWWAYFLLPSAPMLAIRRDKVIPWAYGHLVLFGSIAAVGAGLHVIGYVYDAHAPASVLTAISAIALPVLLFMGCVYALHAWLVSAPSRNALHIVTFLAPLAAIALAAAGWPLWACLLVVLASPAAVVVSYELWEWRTLATQLNRAMSSARNNAE
ncbi:low temperature requirement protein A [Arthrobacter sp. NA-172]|uniref:low temperature requirement protein A n=1 Tax=Arthrobacter sp. NA-172 TaxID=3367524 RepID=UPI003754CD41